MEREKILVNLQRCTGCWSCSLGCKMVNELADDTFRIMVHTVGIWFFSANARTSSAAPAR